MRLDGAAVAILEFGNPEHDVFHALFVRRHGLHGRQVPLDGVVAEAARGVWIHNVSLQTHLLLTETQFVSILLDASRNTHMNKEPGPGEIPGRLRELLGARLEREIYLSTEEAAQGDPQVRVRVVIEVADD